MSGHVADRSARLGPQESMLQSQEAAFHRFSEFYGFKSTSRPERQLLVMSISKSPKMITSPSPVELTNHDGVSKSPSRTSSSKYPPPASKISSTDELEPDVVEAKMDEPNFRYNKMKTSIIPEGWSNDPRKLHPIFIKFDYDAFSLENSGPLLVSTADDGDPRCLPWWGFNFYFWHTVCEKLFYVTKPYELQGILQRMKSALVELPTKELPRLPRERFESSGDYLPLSSEKVPNCWSNRFKDFDDLCQIVDAQELGLALPLPILAYEGHGSAYQLFQSGDRYYVFNQISSAVFRTEEPVRFQEILHT